jgi:pimeloyl-ACP methyl ester carboxylesterase
MGRLKIIPMAAAAGLAVGLVGERRARRRDARIRVSGRTLRLDGRSVRLYESGPQQSPDPVLVLLPGAGDTAESWELVRDVLSASRRVLTYDRPGIGHSEAGAGWDLTAVVDDLHAVLSAAELAAPVVLVGHSFGGLLARAYAAAHPAGVAGLVLVDATPPAIADDPGVRAGFLISALLAKVLKLSAPFGLTRALLVLGAMPLYPEQRHFRQAASREAYRRWIAAVDANFAGNAGQELAAVLPAAAHFTTLATAPPDVPVAVVHSSAYGRRWEQMQRDVAEELHALTVHSTRARRHNIHMVRPDIVIQAIEDVLQHAPPSAGVDG